jgi:hypothetical protein
MTFGTLASNHTYGSPLQNTPGLEASYITLLHLKRMVIDVGNMSCRRRFSHRLPSLEELRNIIFWTLL